MNIWNGFRCEEFEFEGKKAVVVFPDDSVKTGKWMFKTEYFGAFPELEIELLKKGFHLAFVANTNRWGLREDLERKARFADYITEKYGLEEKCVPIGMSCGGLFAIKFASLYPQKVTLLYLDAPVVNLLSCPARLGIKYEQQIAPEEMYKALGLNASTLLSYRDHPLDHLPNLIKNRIPAVLVYGDSDRTVYFGENAALVEQAYEGTEIPFKSIIKHGGDHHPHGLEDNTVVVDYILKNAYL